MLLGFFDERRAIRQILSKVCVSPNPRSEILKATWRNHQKQRGAAIARAGVPNMTPTPPTMDAHIGAVKALDRLKNGVDDLGFDVQMVEVKTLLAFQAGVFEDKVASMQAVLGAAPTDQALAELFLPLKAGLDPKDIQIDQGPPVKWMTRNHNAVVHGAAAGHDPATGQFSMIFVIGEREPCVQAVEFKGKYFLKNGYHRVVAAMRCGVTHIPALVVHAPNWAKVNPALGQDWFFDAGTLMQELPTVSHFASGCQVAIRLWELNLVFSQTTLYRAV